MSDETCPLRRLQEAVENLSGVEHIPESVYLDACNALKDLHPLTKLYKVTYGSVIYKWPSGGVVAPMALSHVWRCAAGAVL